MIRGARQNRPIPLFAGLPGNITGINNLALQLEGGVTSLNGSHEIYSLAIAPGATLAGNGDYTLNAQGASLIMDC